ALELTPHGHQLLDVFGREPRHLVAPKRFGGQEPFRLEPLQGLAHGDAADTELLGEGDLVELFALGELSLDDPASDLGVDAVRLSAALGGIGHGVWRCSPADSSRYRHRAAASRSPSPAWVDASYTGRAASRRGVGAPTEPA